MEPGAVGNIIINAHGEGIGALEHHAHLFPQKGYINALGVNVLSVQNHLAGYFYVGYQIVHAVEGFQKRGFSAAAWAD